MGTNSFDEDLVAAGHPDLPFGGHDIAPRKGAPSGFLEGSGA
jgi:hypothetical protein